MSSITTQSYYSNQVRQLLHIEGPGTLALVGHQKPRHLKLEEEMIRKCLAEDYDYVKLNTVNYCKMSRANRKETVV